MFLKTTQNVFGDRSNLWRASHVPNAYSNGTPKLKESFLVVRRSVYTLFTNFVNNLYYVNTFVMQTNRFRQQRQTNKQCFRIVSTCRERWPASQPASRCSRWEADWISWWERISLLVTSHLPQLFDVSAQLARALCSANNIKTGSPA